MYIRPGLGERRRTCEKQFGTRRLCPTSWLALWLLASMAWAQSTPPNLPSPSDLAVPPSSSKPAVSAPPVPPVAPAPVWVRFEQTRPCMGTLFKIQLYAPNETAAREALDAAFDRIEALNQVFSDYSDTSELTRINQQAGGPAVAVSDDFWRLLKQSEQIFQRSNGAFDITVGPVVRLWRRARRQQRLPETTSLQQALDLVGFSQLTLNADQRTIYLPKPGMRLDFGAVAKGDACWQALQVLRQAGLKQALVVGGGDIAAGDPPPDSTPDSTGWQIQIAADTLQWTVSERIPASLLTIANPAGANPAPSATVETASPTVTESPQLPASSAQPLATISLANAAISTSGATQQYLEVAGVRYSHLVDPRTGLGLTHQLQVSIIAPNGALADGLASAVNVLGIEAGLQLVDNTPETAALIVAPSEARACALAPGSATTAEPRWRLFVSPTWSRWNSPVVGSASPSQPTPEK